MPDSANLQAPLDGVERELREACALNAGPETRAAERAAQSGPTVVVVEDDADASVAGALAASRFVLRRFSSARDALLNCHPDMAGCFVLDHQVRGVGGLNLRQKLAAQGCQQPFIFVSRRGDVESAVEAMHQGAVDSLEKPCDRGRLLDRVQQAIALDEYWRRLRAERADALLRAASLTAREMQVLRLVAAGRITKEIARGLNISPKTVEVHRSNIMRKMRVDSAAELLHLVAKYAVAPLDDRAPVAACVRSGPSECIRP